jgi:hypothetical protein
MNDDLTPDELWLAEALTAISHGHQPDATFIPRPPSSRRRIGTMVLSGILTAAIVSVAILLPRLGFSGRQGIRHPAPTTLTKACQVPFPSAWTAALARSRTAATTDYIFAVAPDGSAYFTEVHSPSWAGLVEVDRASGVTTPIYQFPSSSYQVAQGAFDGRWLVVSLSTSPSSPGASSVIAWDAQTRRITTIVPYDGAATDISFSLDTAPPGTSQGWLEWTIVPGGVGGGGYFLADLSAGTQHQLHVGGPPGPAYFVGPLFVYDVVSPQGAVAEGAIDMGSWKSTTMAPSLIPKLKAAADNGVGSISSYGAAWASLSGALIIWPQGTAGPTQSTVELGQGIDSVIQAGPMLVFSNGTTGAQYLVDITSDAYTQLPSDWSGTATAGNQMVFISHASSGAGKAGPTVTGMAILDVADLPSLPRC